jgi:hypothetical protein
MTIAPSAKDVAGAELVAADEVAEVTRAELLRRRAAVRAAPTTCSHSPPSVRAAIRSDRATSPRSG